MRWVKAWLIVVALVGGLAALLLVMLPRPIQHELDQKVAALLSSAGQGTDLMLRLHSRRWLDATIHASADAQLAETLDQAGRGGSNLDLLHRTALERLRSFNGEWKAHQVIAVDVHGRVVARAGGDEEKWKDDLSPSQVVAQAMRGYRLDDLWITSGKLYTVAAAPVIARDRYAGALVVVNEIGAEFLARLHETMGVEAALLDRGQLIGRSSPSRLIDPLAARVAALRKQHPADGANAGREPIPVAGAEGEPDYAMLVIDLPGEAAARQAMLVLASERPKLASIPTVLARINPAQLPWLELAPILGAVALAIALSTILAGRAHDWPLSRLLSAIQAVVRGEVKLVEDHRLPGRFGSLARMINAALERPGRASVLPVGGAGSSMDMAAEPLPPGFSSHVPASSIPNPLAARSRLGSPAGVPAVGGGIAMSHDSGAMPLPGPTGSGPPLHESPVAPWLGGPAGPPDPTGRLALPQEPTGRSRLPPDTGRSSLPSDPYGAGANSALGSLDDLSDVRSPEAVMRPNYADPYAIGAHPSSLEGMNSSSVIGPSASQYVPADMMGGAPAPFGGGGGGVPDDGLEAEFQQVFQDYIDTRQTCGESVEGVTYDKFSAKLRANREQLITRYGCKRVKFQVYVKDGRAALKATPISE